MDEKKETLAELRSTLFDTLKQLKQGDEKMPIERAKAIVEVSDAIINTAKYELQFLRDVGDDRISEMLNPRKAAEFVRDRPLPQGLETGKFLGAAPHDTRGSNGHSKQ